MTASHRSIKNDEPRHNSRLTYTKAELCEALHLSPVTLWRLEQRGVLMPLRGLRHKIYPVSVVERFLAKGAA
jgi:hypothetical protein